MEPMTATTLLCEHKIIPVVVVKNEAQAMGLARALLEGGISVIEITLRHGFALKAIELVKARFPQMTVLAGTVTDSKAMLNATQAGADGIISPGISEELLTLALDQKTAYLPGVASPSGVMVAMQHKIEMCKLFPASVVGGIAMLKALNGPFPGMRFCPTGGIQKNNYKEYLALSNVACVGGSWLVPSAAVENHEWDRIIELCKDVD